MTTQPCARCGVPDRWAHQSCLVQQKRLLMALVTSSFDLYISVSHIFLLLLLLSAQVSPSCIFSLFISGDTGWTGVSPVFSGEKIMSLALIKAAHLMPLGGGGWIMRWASLCLCISDRIKEPVFDLNSSHALGCLKNLPGGREVSSRGRDFCYVK